MAFQRKKKARSGPLRQALRLRSFVLYLELFNATAGAALTVGVLRIAAGIVKDLELRHRVLADHVGLDRERRRRFLKVKSVQADDPRLDLLFDSPIEEIFLVRPRLGQISVRDLLVTGKNRVRAFRVGQHKRVLAIIVLEKIVNSFLLHESAHEIEIALAVLNAVIPRAIRRRETVLEVREPTVAEDLLDDSRRRQFLIDMAVGHPGQEPQPGDQRGLVASQFPLIRCLLKTIHVAVEIARPPFGQAEPNRCILADDGSETHGMDFAQHFHLELEQAPQFLGRREALQ
jgi:hypothetical protein